MTSAQIFLLGCAILFFTLTLRRVRKEKGIRLHIIGALIVWIGAGMVVVFPDALSGLANTLGIGRGVDLVIYLAIMGLSYALFWILLRLYTIEKNITIIVREKALEEHDDTK